MTPTPENTEKAREGGYIENGKAYHNNKWMPVYYATFYGTLLDIAMEHGYALALHGTLARDMDLIAIPWVENPKPHLEMLAAFQEAIGDSRSDGQAYDSTEVKPNGRVGFTIGSGGGGYLDVSVILPHQRESALEEAARVCETKKVGGQSCELGVCHDADAIAIRSLKSKPEELHHPQKRR